MARIKWLIAGDWQAGPDRKERRTVEVGQVCDWNIDALKRRYVEGVHYETTDEDSTDVEPAPEPAPEPKPGMQQVVDDVKNAPEPVVEEPKPKRRRTVSRKKSAKKKG